MTSLKLHYTTIHNHAYAQYRSKEIFFTNQIVQEVILDCMTLRNIFSRVS